MNKKDDKKAKLIQEKCNTILNQLLRDEDNKYCCDCDQKGPRWASWNLGIFLCIRCAGIHRNLGVHISRVKSVNLDSWSPEQVVCLQQMGNSRARAVYEALLSDNFRRPQTDSGLESFIRSKYEQKKYIAREWIPPPFPPKVDWDKEIEEELENQKRKKKSSSTSSATTIAESAPAVKPPASAASNIIPAPLPKPHSPKNSRLEARKSASSVSSTSAVASSNSNTTNSTNTDLLGLETAIHAPVTAAAPIQNSTTQQKSAAESSITDTFDFFSDHQQPMSLPAAATQNKNEARNGNDSSLKQEEDDFFNQKSLENGGGGGGGSSGVKLTNDKILALYGSATSSPQLPQFTANFQHQTQQPLSLQDSFFYGQQQQQQPAAANASLFKTQIPQQQFFPNVGQQPAMQSQPSSLMFNGNNNYFGNVGFGTMQSQQINKLNEENIRKIESLNFNNFK